MSCYIWLKYDHVLNKTLSINLYNVYLLNRHLIKKGFFMMAFRPNEKLDPIKGERASYNVLDKILGRGATAEVGLIEECNSKKKYALKTISKKYGCKNNKSAERYYNREYDILKKLGRIDPVKITTMNKKRTICNYHIVMDFIEGTQLWKFIHKSNYCVGDTSLPREEPQKLLRIGLNILLDSYKLQQAGILLISDKTENIIVDTNTLQATHVGFGFSEDEYDFKKDPGRKMLFKGAPEMSAPELLKQGEVIFNKATAMYAAGAVLREFLLGDNFEIDYNIMMQFYDGKLDTISQDRRIVPPNEPPLNIEPYPDIKKLLLKLTSDSPEDRPSLEAAIETFEEALKLQKGSSIKNALFDEHFKNALAEYKKEKQKYFGIRWLFTSKSTADILMELNNYRKQFDLKKEENKEHYFDQKDKQYYYYEKRSQVSELDKYQKAKTFISKNPHSTFAKKLAFAMNDPQLIKIIDDHDAKPWWRRCFG